LAISGPLEKQKRFYINMLFNQLSSMPICSFCVDEGKDRKNKD
jgi:hypothetical protein